MTLLVLVFAPVLFAALAVWLIHQLEGWIREALGYDQEDPE